MVKVNDKKPNGYSSAGTKVQRCKQSKFQRPAPLAPVIQEGCKKKLTKGLLE